MSIENLANEAKAFALPLTNRFRSIDVRYGLVFAGSAGWAEFAPFDEYDDEISGRCLASALEQAFDDFPDRVRDFAPVNAIIPAVPAANAAALAFKAVVENGMTTLKVKVAQSGQSATDDLARLSAIRAQLNDLAVSPINIRIDVNGAWNVQEAIELIPKYELAAGGLEYVEQPCTTLAQCAQVKAQTSVKIAIDEGLRLAKQIDPAAIRNSADVLIVKSLPQGGVKNSLQAISQIGLPVVVSGSLDTSIGLVSGLALACSVSDLAGACGLGTGLLFEKDLVNPKILPRDGVLYFSKPSPDPDLLGEANQALDQSVQKAWQERMVRAWHASGNRLVSEKVKQAVENW